MPKIFPINQTVIFFLNLHESEKEAVCKLRHLFKENGYLTAVFFETGAMPTPTK